MVVSFDHRPAPDRRYGQQGGKPVLDLMAAGFTGFCLGWLFARAGGLPMRHRRGL
jgi:hypothetical protein